MSHKATSWLSDVDPDLLMDGDFRVLFHLCDAHNKLSSPETACFPSQKFLMEAAKKSNGGLNNALNRLEAAGLMYRRRTRKADGTKGPTYYILGCDFDDEHKPTPQNGVGSSNSILKAKPTPKSNSTGVEINQETEPGIEPVKSMRSRLPEDWTPSSANWRYANHEHGLTEKEIAEIADDFRGYWTEQSDKRARKTARGWDAAWRNNIQRVASTYKRNRTDSGRRSPHDALLAGFGQALHSGPRRAGQTSGGDGHSQRTGPEVVPPGPGNNDARSLFHIGDE